MSELEVTLLKAEKQLMHYRLIDFETLLADDFYEFGTSGKVYDKQAQLKYVTEEGIEEIPFHLLDFNVQLLAPGIAHVTYKTESKKDGWKSNRSSIWRIENDKWRLYFHQGTPTT